DGFVDESVVLGGIERASILRFLGLMPQYQNNCSSRIDSLIVIVLQFGRSNSITGKHKRAIEYRCIRERDGHEILVHLETRPVHLKLGLRSGQRPRCYFEVLKVTVAVAHRPQPPKPELRGDV